MIAPPKPELVTVNIDGREVAVPKGTNVIEAAKLAGVDVPHYCYHPKLTVVGNCRMCLVEMGLPAVDPATKQPVMDAATGKQKINWMPRPTIGCATNASPGLHIRTTTPLVKDCREGVMEFLLINHPLDCPICDQAGECRLQEQATDYGRGYSRYIEPKNVKPKRTQLGSRVTLDDERCILCSRCVRFCKEVAQDDVLGFIDRGSHSTLTCYPGKRLENNYSLNTVDICPVGALTSTDFRFKMRVWFLKQTNSIDAESSAGANTVAWSREGVIYRLTPRRNDEVNDTWMADSGRLLYKQVRAADRLNEVQVKGLAALPQAAKAEAAAVLGAGGVAVVGSGRSSVEEQFATRRLAEALKGPAWIVGRTGEGDGILVSADRNPNVRGALATGLIKTLPSAKLTELGAKIDAGEIRAVVSIGEDLAAAGLAPAQLAKVAIIYLGTHRNAASEAARVVFPTLTVFEKRGSFINQQFRIQKFAAAVPGPGGATDDLAILQSLIVMAGGTLAADVGVLWETMAKACPVFGAARFANIPETGLLLDGSAWGGLPFVEKAGLKYRPAEKAAEPSTPSGGEPVSKA
ncbi:MAG TPA: 2Fe-2S iron-sulfur cluster-binding protein [Opitutaceae bacterium]|jgi:NADH-quinone oxidoreductase subunit G|nr:2Fe-2S iron-sulfur cluster-binding protein [Opitutaceae bacterium]